MNVLTQIKNQQDASLREIELGLPESASWHAKYKHSAYVFVGGIHSELTEGDVLAILSKYGEIVDVFVPRDEKTGKSKGFAFVCYLDQRSTIIAVDNLNGSKVLGRILRVDHCEDYRLREEFNKKILKWKCSLCGGDNFEGRERCFKCNGNAPKEAYVEVKREEEEGASSSSSSSEDDDEKEEKDGNEKQRGEEEEKDEQTLMNELKKRKEMAEKRARAIAEGKPLPQEEDEDEKEDGRSKKRAKKEKKEKKRSKKEKKKKKKGSSSSSSLSSLS
jgi:RNA-binding motif X-linked protein 2